MTQCHRNRPGYASRTTRSDEDRDIGWDAWGPWSDCSRTCGGGASYSLRRCLSGGSCDGKNIRYRTCSNTDCPVESGDFRAQQCSAHNDIKYQGVTYEWVPAPYDSSAPCALRCQAKGGSLTVELAPKVLDGTRCRVDAFDMCISGVCQEVGCDRELASGAREDNCGVCSGDGSTCQLVRGQAIPHLTPEQCTLCCGTPCQHMFYPCLMGNLIRFLVKYQSFLAKVTIPVRLICIFSH
uniref:ADAMTS/ADAMTS-like cysteine-rich domain-containing protein n=1 Tax=Amphiprion percula TaxID=161767 RepID=A0A3P8RLE3_AMPPE